MLPKSQRKIKPSRILLSTGVKGLRVRSVSTDLGLDIFGRAKTSAPFQRVGMEP